MEQNWKTDLILFLFFFILEDWIRFQFFLNIKFNLVIIETIFRNVKTVDFQMAIFYGRILKYNF
jgi:hypothetical protein